MGIGRAVLSLCSWFTDLPGVNGGEANGDPLLRNSKWIQILESLSCFILLDVPCRKYPRDRHISSKRINQLPRVRIQYPCRITKQLRCLGGQELRACPSYIQLSEYMKKIMVPVTTPVFPQTWLMEWHWLGLHGNGSDYCSSLPRRSGTICPWISPPSPWGGNVVLWWEGSMQMSMASWEGRTCSGWETAFRGFTSASQKFRKKLLSFQILAKEDFLNLEDGHKNT